MTGIPVENADAHPILEVLGRQLKNPSYEVRQFAVRQLESRGDDRAVELLCRALEDDTSGVTIAAAEALARIGNAAAIPALTRALRRHRLIAAPRRQKIVGAVLLLMCPALIFGPILLRPHQASDQFLAARIMLGMLCFCARSTLTASSDVHRAVSDALAKLTACTASPEAREALPDLRELSRDIFAEDRRTRIAYRRAAETIEHVTAVRRSLPVPVDAVSNAEVLPIPWDGPSAEISSLPRPSCPEARTDG